MMTHAELEVIRQNELLKLWSKANLNIIRRLAEVERENEALKDIIEAQKRCIVASERRKTA